VSFVLSHLFALKIVIPGLNPGIHEFFFVDGRAKPGHDD